MSVASTIDPTPVIRPHDRCQVCDSGDKCARVTIRARDDLILVQDVTTTELRARIEEYGRDNVSIDYAFCNTCGLMYHPASIPGV